MVDIPGAWDLVAIPKWTHEEITNKRFEVNPPSGRMRVEHGRYR